MDKRGDKVKRKTEVVWDKSRNAWLQSPEAGRDKEQILPWSPWRKHSPAGTWISDL